MLVTAISSSANPLLSNTGRTQAAVSSSQSSLARYDVFSIEDLPSNAAATGILADGSVYVEPYKMLTQSDQSLLKAATGQSFDATTLATEQANGMFKGNALAAAIGFDRSTGTLSGDLTSSYFQSIARVLDDPKNTGYEGFQITSSDLANALSVLKQESSGGIDVST